MSQKICIKMQSISVISDITKVADFQRKNDDDSKSHWVCYMIYIFFGSSLGKVQLGQVSSFNYLVYV